jgi:hypothetical protein
MKHSLESLAERIKSGVTAYGVHVLHKEEIAALWNNDDALEDWDKRRQVENFARHYGLAVHLSENLTIAVFRSSN